MLQRSLLCRRFRQSSWGACEPGAAGAAGQQPATGRSMGADVAAGRASRGRKGPESEVQAAAAAATVQQQQSSGWGTCAYDSAGAIFALLGKQRLFFSLQLYKRLSPLMVQRRGKAFAYTLPFFTGSVMTDVSCGSRLSPAAEERLAGEGVTRLLVEHAVTGKGEVKLEPFLTLMLELLARAGSGPEATAVFGLCWAEAQRFMMEASWREVWPFHNTYCQLACIMKPLCLRRAQAQHSEYSYSYIRAHCPARRACAAAICQPSGPWAEAAACRDQLGPAGPDSRQRKARPRQQGSRGGLERSPEPPTPGVALALLRRSRPCNGVPLDEAPG